MDIERKFIYSMRIVTADSLCIDRLIQIQINVLETLWFGLTDTEYNTRIIQKINKIKY